jgi:hypothetical protein
MTSIPAALWPLLEGGDRDLLDHPDPDLVIAETTEQMVQVLIDAGIGIDELLADPAIVEPLGGFEYVRAVLTWRDDSLTWARSRRRRKGPAPEPPKAPTG